MNYYKYINIFIIYILYYYLLDKYLFLMILKIHIIYSNF